MMFKSLPIIAAAASLAAFGAARAQPVYPLAEPPPDTAPSVGEVVITPPYLPPGAELRQMPVFYTDLDLSTPEGGYTLLGRIRAAAVQVCKPESTYPDNLSDVADYQRCIHRAVDRAVDEVGAPSVQDALYEFGVGSADLGG